MVDDATPWDTSLKVLLSEKPQDFASWILKGAIVKEKLLTEFTGRKVNADALLNVMYEGEEVLLHIEFQSGNDADMAERLLEYNFRARREHKRDVYSCVIYLRQDGNVPTSPLIWTFTKDKEILRFHFQNIELAKLSADDLRQTNLLGILPLMILTKGGATHEKAEEILTRLQLTEQKDMLQVTYTLFKLVLNEEDQQWLERRIQQMYNLFREISPYKEEINAAREEGREEGREQGREEALKAIEEGLKKIEEERQKRLQENRQILVNLVQRLFPSLATAAKNRVDRVTELPVLQEMIMKMFIATTLEEAALILVEVPDVPQKHDA